MIATDEQFAAAYDAFYAQAVATDSFPLAVDMGRAMLAALEAHCPELFAKPQGLNLLQEVTLRLMCAGMTGNVENAAIAARAILALGEPQ